MCDAEGKRGRRFRFDRHLGEHTAHQGLVNQLALKGGAVRRVPERVRERLTHIGCGRKDAVQTGMLDHVDDRAHATAFLTDQDGMSIAVFDFG